MKHLRILATLGLAVCGAALYAQKKSQGQNLVAQADVRPSPAPATASPLDLKTTKDDDLIQASKTASIQLKAQIAEELVERKSPKVEQLFREFLSDNGTFEQNLGSVTYQSTAAAELFASVARQKEKAERLKYYQKTNSKAIQSELKGLFGRDYSTKWTVAECEVFLPKLTALALAKDDVNPLTLNQIFQTLDYRSKNYQRSRFFAQKHASPELLATLARFKNPADVGFIRQQNEKSYLAISLFPHGDFFAQLKNASPESYLNTDYQNAVCAFKSTESKALLEKMCDGIFASHRDKTERDDQLFQLYSIIEKHNSKLYAPVLKKIDGLMARS